MEVRKKKRGESYQPGDMRRDIFEESAKMENPDAIYCLDKLMEMRTIADHYPGNAQHFKIHGTEVYYEFDINCQKYAKEYALTVLKFLNNF